MKFIWMELHISLFPLLDVLSEINLEGNTKIVQKIILKIVSFQSFHEIDSSSRSFKYREIIFFIKIPSCISSTSNCH